MTDPLIQQLIETLSGIPSPQREDIIRKIKLFAEADAKAHQKRQFETADGRTITNYLPPLTRLDVVHCHFTGVGYEWDGPHYAIVWNVNPTFDAVTVIPTTSEKRVPHANVFSVGQILGLPKGDTTLLVGDTTTVSRKRLDLVPFMHPKKKVIQNARLAQSWLDRIFEAMAVSFGGEVTFESFLAERTGIAMPRDLSILREWRFMPIRGSYDPDSNVMKVRKWNSDVVREEELILPNTVISRYEKGQLVRHLLSPDPEVREAAEAKYLALYHAKSSE